MNPQLERTTRHESPKSGQISITVELYKYLAYAQNLCNKSVHSESNWRTKWRHIPKKSKTESCRSCGKVSALFGAVNRFRADLCGSRFQSSCSPFHLLHFPSFGSLLRPG